MVRYGLVYFGMARYGPWETPNNFCFYYQAQNSCFGMVWHDLAWIGMAQYGMTWYGRAGLGMVCHHMVWHDLAWFDMVWHGKV